MEVTAQGRGGVTLIEGIKKDTHMWQLGTWFSCELGNVGLTIGFNALRGLFWSKLFFFFQVSILLIIQLS